MDSGERTAASIYNEYKEDCAKLIAYLPWLEEKSGKAKIVANYSGEGVPERTLHFPIYDGMLLRFVQDARETKLVDINYRYTYSANRLNDFSSEREFIRNQTILDIKNIGSVLSKYVLGGQTKARMWSEAIDEGIFLVAVTQLKELMDFWRNALEGNISER